MEVEMITRLYPAQQRGRKTRKTQPMRLSEMATIPGIAQGLRPVCDRATICIRAMAEGMTFPCVMQDIRSVVPTQLIAENGSDLVVINFGSANLRIGLATADSPVEVPHCIAHHILVPVDEAVGDERRKKGSVAEHGVPTMPISGSRKAERDEICQMVELQLKMKPFVPDQKGSPKDWTSIQLDEDESFPWTRVVDNNPAPQMDARVAKPVIITSSEDGHHSTFTTRSAEASEGGIGPDLEEGVKEEPEQKIEKEAEKEILTEVKEETTGELEENIVQNSEEETQKKTEEVVEDSEEETRKDPIENIVEDSEEETLKEPEAAISPSEQESRTEPKQEVHDGPDLEIHVEVRLEPEDSIKPIETVLQNSVSNAIKYRKYLCGSEALNIAVSEPYTLRRPICRGHLNVTQQYSLQQVCDDLYSIWDWVLIEKLSLEAKAREQLSAVLVIPDTLDNREIKEVLSIILRDLNFRSAVVLQESVAATFGNGISTACVVNMGAQVTSIVCVEDGVAIPTTRTILPFGGEDISRCLLYVQQRWQTWPPIDTDPLDDTLDLHILEYLKEAHCLIIEGDQSAVIEIPYHEAGKPSQLYTGSLTALNVPIMGLFYPSLLAPEEYPAPMRPGFHVDHEDVLDDSFQVDTSRKSDIPNAGLPSVANGVAPLVAEIADVTVDDHTGSQGSSSEESTLGLSRAIVNCIMLTTEGRQDLQKKLFASIQLVGGTAYTRGLVDAVEERVLHDIPAHEAVDTVAVLTNRTDTHATCWNGGAVLGILDFSRDAWVNHDDWVTGGVRLNCGRKYKDSYTLHSQALYYTATLE